jgi:hypothetical protein
MFKLREHVVGLFAEGKPGTAQFEVRNSVLVAFKPENDRAYSEEFAEIIDNSLALYERTQRILSHTVQQGGENDEWGNFAKCNDELIVLSSDVILTESD